ncbi:FimB/Mfa2 family fimbrial subunit [Bacteroides sp. KG123]|uniref:FimB/Mfa2 family fimbrial subunit n=1 Tax=unclassified Bacteroides TaxID=2646097 RepID=UPI003D7F1996
MKGKFVLVCSLFALMALGACSEKNDSPNGGIDEGAKSKLVVQLNFEGVSANTKAQSTAIPATSWANIKQVQFLLYDAATNNVRFSAVATPNTSAAKTFTYTDVPAGTYKLVAVANAKSSTDKIVTYSDGGTTPVEWDMWNVRQKKADNLVMKHKTGSFPSFCSAKLTSAGNTAYSEPSEIFMGSVDNVVVAAGATISHTVALKREVSLMRVRLNVKEGQNGVDNNTTMDYTKDASILIYRLPEKMRVLAGNDGGVDANSLEKHVLSIEGTDVFKKTDPTTGYSAGGKILKDNFTMWRDIIVFPNNGGRANDGATTANADGSRQYFIVVSASGKAGHVLADGTKLDSPAPVYWSGVVKENFVPNVIREVNLTLRTGGTTDVPTAPTTYGGLTIKVSEPTPWNSNIVESSIIM